MKRSIAYLALFLFLWMGIPGYSNNNDIIRYVKAKEPPVPFAPPHPELPIDGALTILLLAGTIYGAHKSKN
jgi:hypothetical protein